MEDGTLQKTSDLCFMRRDSQLIEQPFGDFIGLLL